MIPFFGFGLAYACRSSDLPLACMMPLSLRVQGGIYMSLRSLCPLRV